MFPSYSKRNAVPTKDTVVSREPPTLKNKRRFCKVEGCNRIVKSQGLCQRHGAKPQKCRVVECSKQAQGGFGGMCKAHFRASQSESIDYQIVAEEAQVESVNDRVIPASLSWTPRSGGPMPLIAHLKDGMDSKKPPGWHRNEERRARHLAPVAQLMTEFEDWEIELLYSESLILTGTSQLSFKYLAFGWGREVGFHTELVKSVCASRRVMLPSSVAAASIAASNAGPLAVWPEVAGSTESTTSSHQSSRNSPSLPSQNREEDTNGTSSPAPSAEDEANLRRRQMQQQNQRQQRAEQTFADVVTGSMEDPRAALAGMSSKLTSDQWMNYSVGKLEEVDEAKPVNFQPDHHPTSSFADIAKWGASEEWMQYNDWDDNNNTNDNGNNQDGSMNGFHNRSASATLAEMMSSKLTDVDEPTNTVKLQEVDEIHPATAFRPGHHRGGLPAVKPPRKTSEDWIKGSIGNMDDFNDIEYDTYCLSMQFDEVTLQNIYREQDQS